MPIQLNLNEPSLHQTVEDPAKQSPHQDNSTTTSADEQQQWLMSFGSSDEHSMTSSDEEHYEDEEEPTSWYARNDTAFTDPRQMRKHILGQARMGLDMVNALQASAASKKKVDVTGKRRERKSVLPQNIWGQVEQELMAEGIQLVSREKGGPAEGRTKATLTYYGTSAVFYNHQVRTKIRMRIRYYLSYVKQADGSLTDVQREGATREAGFLELKVKSPRAFEENSVDKYRLLVSDALMAQLINLDATEATFLNQLDEVKQAIQQENTEQTKLIDTMFAVLGKLAQRKPAFIKPSLVISYERSAYKYIEKDYPIPVKEAASGSKKKRNLSEVHQSKKGSKKLQKLSQVLQWRRRGWGKRRIGEAQPKTHLDHSATESSTEAQHHRDEELEALHKADGIFYDPPPQTPADQQAVEHHDIEYQFTIDRNVRAHYPLLPLAGATQMPVAQHFDVSNDTELMRYPVDARVIEFKEPLVVAEIPKKDRSDDHNTLVNVLVSKMERLIMWGDYDANVGKYGNLRSRIMQEHKTNRIKNELIEIDFSGKGEYKNSN